MELHEHSVELPEGWVKLHEEGWEVGWSFMTIRWSRLGKAA